MTATLTRYLDALGAMYQAQEELDMTDTTFDDLPPFAYDPNPYNLPLGQMWTHTAGDLAEETARGFIPDVTWQRADVCLNEMWDAFLRADVDLAYEEQAYPWSMQTTPEVAPPDHDAIHWEYHQLWRRYILQLTDAADDEEPS